MAFWDKWTKKKELAPGESEGKLRGGKKHGRWRERAKEATTRWTGSEFVPVDYALTELTYVDGVKQGPYTIWWGSGGKREEGTYVDGERDGFLMVWNREGKIVGEGTMRAGQLHGRYRENHFATGQLSYEGEWSDGKRHGPWRSGYEEGGLQEEGAHVFGERDGAWTFWAKQGAIVERGGYRMGKREGAWQVYRADGGLRASGDYADGAPVGMWRFYAPGGAERTPRECFDEADLVRWELLETCVELLVVWAPTAAWIDRVKGAFAELAQPWQVEAKRDRFGQTLLSAPIGAYWQLRVAAGVPEHIVLRDECWSKVLRLVEEWPVERVASAVEVALRAGRYPSCVARDWLTRIFDGDSDDPRTRLVSRFEPGREFTPLMMERFRTRVPHCEELSLRECEFPFGIAPLFEAGFPELELLLIVRSVLDDAAIAALIEQLAGAPWTGKLVQLAIVDNGTRVTDKQLAALIGSLRSLRFLALDNAQLGAQAAAALPQHPSLEVIDLRESKISAGAAVALAGMPKLAKLRLRGCKVARLDRAHVAAIATSPTLRKLELEDTDGGDKLAAALPAATVEPAPSRHQVVVVEV